MEWQTVVIPSDPNFMGVVERQILVEIEKVGVEEERIFAVRLALEEAIANAIKHGNKMDPAKKVTIRFLNEKDRLTSEVADEGDGFDYESIPDPTDAEHLPLPHGRGILLMRAYADEVTFNDLGNRVRLVVHLNEDHVEEGCR